MNVRLLRKREATPSQDRHEFADLCAEAVRVARELRELEGPGHYTPIHLPGL